MSVLSPVTAGPSGKNFHMADPLRWILAGLVSLLALCGPTRAESTDVLLSGHPRESYRDVKDIDAMEDALRRSLAAKQRYSFSRSWWKWDRLRCRYVDGGLSLIHI